DAGVGKRERVGLELVEDLDPCLGAQREDRGQGGADLGMARDAPTVGRHDAHGAFLMEVEEAVEVAGSEGGRDQLVNRVGAAGGHLLLSRVGVGYPEQACGGTARSAIPGSWGSPSQWCRLTGPPRVRGSPRPASCRLMPGGREGSARWAGRRERAA